MKFSVVIPNFNDRRIQRAVASVQKQSFDDYELIIVDGGSTDAALLAYYETLPPGVVAIGRDNGIFDALNKGVARTTGDVVYLMGADDELSDEHVFRDVARMMERETAIDGVCIGCDFVNASGQVIRSWYPRRVTRKRMLRGLLPPHFSLFLRKRLYELAGPFKWQQFSNVACDIIWLMDVAIAKPDLRIDMLPSHHLRMEYGGASTGSMGAVARQFKAVARYARERGRDLPFWPLYSPVRTFSKVIQFRLPRG